MLDREKVIHALGTCNSNNFPCKECGYFVEDMDYDCIGEMMKDAFALLREQKPVVSCGDCKYWNAGTCLNDKVSWQIEDCGCHPDFVTDSSWFCAEGEQR